MTINRDVLAESVAGLLSSELAERTLAALAAGPKPGEENERDAGRALAIALSSLDLTRAAQGVDALALYCVEMGANERLILGPVEAYTHPLISSWVATTFADAVGDCLRSGRLAFNFAPGAPLYDAFELMETGGAITNAVVTLTFEGRGGAVPVRFQYGAPVAGALGRTNILAGDAVWRLGSLQRGACALPPADEGEDEAGAGDEPSPVGPVLH